MKKIIIITLTLNLNLFAYNIVGILVNNSDFFEIKETNTVFKLKPGDVIQFVGTTNPNAQESILIEDPLLMQTLVYDVKSDSYGKFFYPSTYFEAISKHIIPDSGTQYFSFDNNFKVVLSSTNYSNWINNVVDSVNLYGYDFKSILNSEKNNPDSDMMEYMRWRQNVNNGETISTFDWDAVERGRKKYESLANDDTFLRTVKATNEGIVYGYEAVLCGVGSAGTGGVATLAACTPLVLHLSRDISNLVIDSYVEKGKLDKKSAELWKGFSTVSYSVISFAVSGNPYNAFEVGEFFLALYDGTAQMVSSKPKFDSKGKKYIYSEWQFEGINIKMLILGNSNPPAPPQNFIIKK